MQTCANTDDTTFHACNLNLKSLIKKLQHNLMLTFKHEMIWASIGNTKIWESIKQKLLETIIGLRPATLLKRETLA